MPELLGYTYRKCEDEPGVSKFAAYLLSEKTGSPRYYLLRNKIRPEMLFAIHAWKLNKAKIKGFSWFTDKDGELKPVF